jgi:hypothetical protein
MIRISKPLVLVLTTFAAAVPAAAQEIENELVLVTPVAKTLTDPALAEFAKYAKERWKVDVRTSALAAGTPVAYGRVVEWKGRPEADIFWGGESALFDKLAEQKLLARLDLPKGVVDSIPASIGKPKPIPLKDPKGFWIGTVLEPYGLVYHPKLLARLGVPAPKDWDDLLHPKLKGNVAQCAPTRSSSSHATYEVILQRDGDAKGWEWLKRLAGNTGIFTARSRDVPSVVREASSAGFAVPSYMAFEDRLARARDQVRGPEDRVDHARADRHPRRRQASQGRARLRRVHALGRGQKVAMERGVFRSRQVPRPRRPGLAGGDGRRVHRGHSLLLRRRGDQHLRRRAQGRYEAVNTQFRKEIESVADELKRK